MPRVFLTRRDAFAHEFAARDVRWSGHNVSRMLRLTGERPARVEEMRAILDTLASDSGTWRAKAGPWFGTGGVFDHGEMWGRGGKPVMLVGHPYGISDEARERLAALARFPGLVVGVDDRPSYYGHGTHHVRVALAEVRRPYEKFPSTPKTRKAACAARRAFAEAFGEDR